MLILVFRQDNSVGPKRLFLCNIKSHVDAESSGHDPFSVAFASLPLGGVVVLCNNTVIARLVGCFFLGGSWETQSEHLSDFY